MARRLDQVLLLGACTAAGPLALNLYLPALPLVQQDFAAGVSEVQFTVSLSLLGLGLLLLGPLSDRFGRRPCLLGGLGVFALGSAIAALAPNLAVMAAARFVLAAAAALVFISARTVVADTSPRAQLAREVAQVTMINVIAQSVAPLMGTVVMGFGGNTMVLLCARLAAAGGGDRAPTGNASREVAGPCPATHWTAAPGRRVARSWAFQAADVAGGPAVLRLPGLRRDGSAFDGGQLPSAAA
jgi:MFS family permease